MNSLCPNIKLLKMIPRMQFQVLINIGRINPIICNIYIYLQHISSWERSQVAF